MVGPVRLRPYRLSLTLLAVFQAFQHGSCQRKLCNIVGPWEISGRHGKRSVGNGCAIFGGPHSIAFTMRVDEVSTLSDVLHIDGAQETIFALNTFGNVLDVWTESGTGSTGTSHRERVFQSYSLGVKSRYVFTMTADGRSALYIDGPANFRTWSWSSTFSPHSYGQRGIFLGHDIYLNYGIPVSTCKAVIFDVQVFDRVIGWAAANAETIFQGKKFVGSEVGSALGNVITAGQELASDHARTPMVTAKGCSCLQYWTFAQIGARYECNDYCCSFAGSSAKWCFVEDEKCEGEYWGYCPQVTRVTQNGCTCYTSWQFTGYPLCTESCCEISAFPGQQICQVDTHCEGINWGICAPAPPPPPATSTTTTTRTASGNTDPGGALSIAFTVRVDEYGDRLRLLDFGADADDNGVQVTIGSDGILTWEQWGASGVKVGEAESPSPIPLGESLRVLVSLSDSGLLDLHINGSLVSSAFGEALPAAPRRMILGAGFRGVLEDLYLFREKVNWTEALVMPLRPECRIDGATFAGTGAQDVGCPHSELGNAFGLAFDGFAQSGSLLAVCDGDMKLTVAIDSATGQLVASFSNDSSTQEVRTTGTVVAELHRYLVSVADTGFLQLFMDGALLAEANGPQPLVRSTPTFRLGGNCSGGDFLTGYVMGLQIFGNKVDWASVATGTPSCKKSGAFAGSAGSTAGDATDCLSSLSGAQDLSLAFTLRVTAPGPQVVVLLGDSDLFQDRVTKLGCACKEQWTSERGSCTDHCCNPDHDSGGEWCIVENTTCQGEAFGYCEDANVWARVTQRGCACKEEWSYQWASCADYCCKAGTQDDWCMVEDTSCEGQWWGYCKVDDTGRRLLEQNGSSISSSSSRRLQASSSVLIYVDASGKLVFRTKRGTSAPTVISTANSVVGAPPTRYLATMTTGGAITLFESGSMVAMVPGDAIDLADMAGKAYIGGTASSGHVLTGELTDFWVFLKDGVISWQEAAVDITTTSSTSTTTATTSSTTSVSTTSATSVSTTTSATSVSATTSTSVTTVTDTFTTSWSSTTKTATETLTTTAGITTAGTAEEATGTTVASTMLLSTVSEVAAAVHVLTTASPDSTSAEETSGETIAQNSATDLDSTTAPDATTDKTMGMSTAQGSATNPDATVGPDATTAEESEGVSTPGGSTTNLEAIPDATVGPDVTTAQETKGVSTTGVSATDRDADPDATTGPDATTAEESEGVSTPGGSPIIPSTTGNDAAEAMGTRSTQGLDTLASQETTRDSAVFEASAGTTAAAASTTNAANSSESSRSPAVFARSAGPATTAPPKAGAPQGTELQSAEAMAESQTRPATLRSTSSPPEVTTTTEDEICTASAVLEQARQRTKQLLPRLRASRERSEFLREDCGNTVLTPLSYASLVGKSTQQPPAAPLPAEYVQVPVPQAETVVELPRSLLEVIRPQVPAGDEVVLSVTTILGKDAADMASRPPPGIAGDTIDVSGAAVIDLALLSGAFINVSKLTDPMLFTLPVPFEKGLLGARWDEEDESWRKDGASASPGNSGDVVKCSTRHLGLFAALFWGFVDAFLCSQFSLLTRERIDEVRRAQWAVGATMWTACWACWLCLAVVVLVLERLRRKSHPWRDEFLFFIEGPQEATESAEVARVNTELEESQSSNFLKQGVVQSASSVFRGSTSIARDILDDVCAKYFEYFSEARTTIEGLLDNCTPEKLRCMTVRAAMQKALNHMVHGMSSRLAGAQMNMDQDLVACITQDDGMRHVLAAVRGEEVIENKVLFHSDQVEMWAALHNQLLDQVDRHLTKTSWCDAKSVAALIWSQMPVGAMMSFHVFTSCRKKLFFTMLEFQGALMCSVGFFATSGSVRGKQLDNVPMCDPPEAASYYGRLFALSTASLLVAWLPVAALQSLQTRRLVRGSVEDMTKLLRTWKTQDRAIYVMGTLYLAMATFLVAVFLANLDAEDNVDMATSMAITALQEHLLAPIAYGLTMPLLAHFILCTASRMSKSRRHEIVHAVRDAFYKSAVVEPPSVDI